MAHETLVTILNSWLHRCDAGEHFEHDVTLCFSCTFVNKSSAFVLSF